MKTKIFILIAALMVFAAITPEKVHANAVSADHSAILAGTQMTAPVYMEKDTRAQILKSYLEQYNSPLAANADTFVKEADANNLDWKMVAAISGVESTYGEAIPPYSYNAWGFGVYGTNVRRFTSWDDGITVVSEALRHDYIDGRGETTVYQIGSSYAASPTWAARVQQNMNSIDEYASRFDNPTLSISL